MKNKIVQWVILYVFLSVQLFANNINLNNVILTGRNTTSHFVLVQFDISWENSWRDAVNWDAAWVFIKFRIQGQPQWQHASLNVTGFFEPSGSTISVPSDGKGFFIYRSVNGTGNIVFNNLQLRWNYGIDGVNDNDEVELFVAGIEMVYVSQGSFWIGDASVTNIAGHFEAGVSGLPYQVTSEAGITLGGGGTGSLGNNNRSGMHAGGADGSLTIDEDFDDAVSQILPAAFPKGFNAFYCMKYELSQQQYVDFLNHITAAQSATRYSNSNPFAPATHRYNITGTYPNFTTTSPFLPCTYVEFYDGAAYADWAALRPMTELEFEKSCRGPDIPIADEFAWGTNTVNATTMFISNADATNETISTGYSSTTGNAWYRPVNGANSSPLRCGIFSANASNNGRITAGASYYGIMELSGNCWERCVSVGNVLGRGFLGTHGDGILSTNGGANNTDWPGYNYNNLNNEVDGAVGAGYRGAGFDFPIPVINNMRVSSRIVATSFWPNSRYFDDCFRAVRTVE